MSIMLCSDHHTYILGLFLAQCDKTPKQASKNARALRALNSAALFARYGDTAEPLERSREALVSAEQALKALTYADVAALACCFEYQCDALEKTHANFATLERVHAAVMQASGGKISANVWSI